MPSHHIFRKEFLIALGSVALIATQSSFACPEVSGIIDWNCDGHVEVSAFGDSITFGTRDGRRLGYPGRLKKLVPDLVINNFGDPGEETKEGRSRAPREFRKKTSADFVITLEGVNDYFDAKRSVSSTKRNLLSIRDSGKRYGAISLLSRLTSTRRSYQKSWINSVNSAISKYTTLDFFRLGTGILSSDNLHPNDDGYERMANHVLDKLRQVSVANRPADRDQDGIYDFAEARFNTDIHLADSDNDGLLDGEEVFRYHSNPRLTDTDGDGYSDSYEANTLGSDPTSPLPTAPVLESIQVLAN